MHRIRDIHKGFRISSLVLEMVTLSSYLDEMLLEGHGTELDKEINFGMNHALGTGSIVRPADLQPMASALPLYCGCPRW